MSHRIIRRILISFTSLLVLFSIFAYSASYTVNPGDLLRIDVWNEDNLNREVLVRPDGMISLPMVGEIDTTDNSPSQVSEKVARALGNFMKDTPQVVVSLIDASGNKIFVIGKVVRSGEFKITSETDVMQALALAGGLNTFAAENDIRILRRQADGTQIAIPFEYAKVKTGKELQSNIILRSRDIVIVP
jgi:polysaccharide export outer membrane protein